MKPQHALISVFFLIGIQQFFHYLKISHTEVSLVIQYVCLAGSFFMLMRFVLRGLSINTDNPMLIIMFAAGFWISAFSCVFSIAAGVNIFNSTIFLPINQNLPLYGNIVGQFLMIGGFALNGIEEEVV